MGEKIVVGPLQKGLSNYYAPFNIDNDAFPTLFNAYQWRGRVKRKRGTQFLGRLQRYFNSSNPSYNPGSTTITLDGTGSGNLLTGFTNLLTAAPNASLVIGSIAIIDSTGPQTYTDPNQDGTLTGSSGGTGTINYQTGAFTITGGAGHTVTATFRYYPSLFVMGLEDVVLPTNTTTGTQADNFPMSMGFDTTYAYNILPDGLTIYDISFYKNPASATYPNYVRKANTTPFTWVGQNYQQFWTVNYQGALWATNGIQVPFNKNVVGMQFKLITGIMINSALPPALATLTIVAHGLVKGDFLFINEVGGITGINFQTGYVVSNDPQEANTVQVEFPNAILGGAYTSGGIAQYLTNTANPAISGIRWYDGDPTNGSAVNPLLNSINGWVNFAPPLISGPNNIFSIDDTPPAQYYLVGARMIMNFKDRLLFFGPVIQTSAANSQIYLQDTVIWSQNGTPYYTASFDGTVTNATLLNTFTPILTPPNQVATPSAWFEDIPGFGGYLSAGYATPITSVANNEDVLIVGFSNKETRFVFTGDLTPFNFFVINSEYGTDGTFSTVTMDRGVHTVGDRGILLTSQIGSQRIDLDIPDQVFQLNLNNNGPQRICAQRDYINEWIYFTYCSNTSIYPFPDQTLLYNYRDESWGIFNENYTTYGQFRQTSGDSWSKLPYNSWIDWDTPWNEGDDITLFQTQVIGGNQQGFIMVRDKGTEEEQSLYIQSFSGSTITSPSHGLNTGDFIILTGALGTVSSLVNNKIFQVLTVPTNDTFTVGADFGALTYLGGATIIRMYIPTIQTRQFPLSWALSRKTRIGPQAYLFTGTNSAQVTLQIFLSENFVGPNITGSNAGPIYPDASSTNDALVYSDILYTCPESTNLGLTPANVNLQMPTAATQAQIWHRMNTSLIGDTVQIGFTLSSVQMTSLFPFSANAATITAITQSYPCVITCSNTLETQQLVMITGVVGMTQLNFQPTSPNYYNVIASNSTSITIDVDSSTFSAYISGGTVTPVYPNNQFAEIELHGMVIDVQPSQALA